MADEKTNFPTSHDYAIQLRKMAEWLEARPSFKLPSVDRVSYHHFYFWDKEPFLAAVKAVGAGKKEFTDSDIKLRLSLSFADITIGAPRTTVCRLIRPAEYECDPLLSPEEEKQLGGVA